MSNVNPSFNHDPHAIELPSRVPLASERETVPVRDLLRCRRSIEQSFLRSCHAERSAANRLGLSVHDGAEPKHPENVSGINTASRRSHETA